MTITINGSGPVSGLTTLSMGGALTGVTDLSMSGGLATPSVLTVGQGIKFPAAQSASSDANTLDDYEEGTWTPSSATAGVTVSTIFSAYYIKVGRHVTAYCYLTVSNGTGNFANWQLTGLPFACGSGYGPVFQYYDDFYPSTGGSKTSYVEIGSAYANIVGSRLPNVTNGVMLCFTYFTTT